ncbi:hypothetical protein GCM10023346_16950 [Arthrobacter gyeryongensis]|uniref:Uncharacterized protein n=1 Tax=Arthrobacter gyeryongensis TaxID=1650592 RepID=A0ABP9SB70_9MICC
MRQFDAVGPGSQIDVSHKNIGIDGGEHGYCLGRRRAVMHFEVRAPQGISDQPPHEWLIFDNQHPPNPPHSPHG